MQYHACSLAKRCRVTLIGYAGSPAVSGPNISEIRFAPPRGPRLLKLIVMMWRFARAFVRAGRADVALVQTPPAPVIFVAWLFAPVVCDWHNLGFTLSSRFRTCYYFLERLAAKLPQRHICVTAAMAGWLASQFGVVAFPAPDRPPDMFGRGDREELRKRLGLDDRPLLVSSTSWTPDEDFGMLAEALDLYGGRLLVIVTGKGELRSEFEALIRDRYSKIEVRTRWFDDPRDYASLLAAADLGLSLHSSTSGLDLPMKVVDMLGAGLPVLALEFPTIGELVHHGSNGLIFRDAKSLAEAMKTAFSQLPQLRKHAKFAERWDDMWDANVHPILLPYLEE
ncbi:hypothetical protein CTAYLR_008067 [Chrysophaeum taylorii]|uniref:Glycosyltransferase subfamily 4-like N-terminal domain-containing protein n=1 Tax=Chrysophaeum taylorii TaxID=2483200 RepID=A0AAD7UJM3_9STRA|nr:hypothetical protein CTAYLR_008067 [Chrysophaeum taylorii]